MTRIDKKLPCFRSPALIGGKLGVVSLSEYAPQWITLHAVSCLGLAEALLLDRQRVRLASRGIVSFVLPLAPWSLHRIPPGRFNRIRIPILSDPLMRLHRACRMGMRPPLGRCHSCIIDPRGLIRTQVVHDLNPWGCRAFTEMIEALQQQEEAGKAVMSGWK